MQPQEQQPSTSTPASPSSQYDFIYNGEQKPKRRFSMPGAPTSLPRLVLMVAGGAVVLIIAIVIFSNVFLGLKVNTDELVSVMGRGQEIARVSDIVARDSRDINFQGLARTANSTLNSDQTQIKEYLSSVKKKADSKKLKEHENKKTDDELKAAAQNGNLEATYAAYLKKNLTEYRNSLKVAFENAPTKAKPLLNDAYVSAGTILAAPQFTVSTTQ